MLVSMPAISDPTGCNDDELEMDIDDDNIFDALACKNPNPEHHRRSDRGCTMKPLHLHRREMAMSQPLMIKRASLNHAAIQSSLQSARARMNWKYLARKARCQEDPWQKFHIEEFEAEKCTRYRYNAVRKTWSEDEVCVKMENVSFNRGAMRECFRLKKLSSFTKCMDWNHASNYVAKRYMQAVDEDVYRADVTLQMNAKLWGEHYNRSNPPKKVDIMQMCLLKFKNREGQPLYHLEHFIEGNYIKYNSNSGFVEETLRNTPQSFSHFTFERSGHKLIVVDIQGVGDLYTDPQIHTAEGTDYGDGNLGPRGMALFFHSHVCNAICESLRLTPFDMAPPEEREQERILHSASNSCSSTVIKPELMSPKFSPIFKIDELRERCDSGVVEEGDMSVSPDSPPVSSPFEHQRTPRRRLDTSNSEMDLGIGVMTAEDIEMWHQQQCNFHRPSRIAISFGAVDDELAKQHAVLGQIHHEMARFHEVGRFLLDREHETVDWESALFHEKMAADHGFLEATLNMARYYLNLQHDVLSECPERATEDDVTKGIMYMTRAAESGDRASMIFLGEAYQKGMFECAIDYENAVRWYDKAIAAADDTDADGGYDATMNTPLYELQARIGDLYYEGGYCLERDPSSAGDYYTEAAEGATNAMKGRRAAKLYELAEIAYGEVEEE